jgi:hypothetical protein
MDLRSFSQAFSEAAMDKAVQIQKIAPQPYN